MGWNKITNSLAITDTATSQGSYFLHHHLLLRRGNPEVRRCFQRSLNSIAKCWNSLNDILHFLSCIKGKIVNDLFTMFTHTINNCISCKVPRAVVKGTHPIIIMINPLYFGAYLFGDGVDILFWGLSKKQCCPSPREFPGNRVITT